jgi:hypothetical protein
LEKVQGAVAELAGQYSADTEIESIIKQGQENINQQIRQYQETDSITQLIAVPTLAKNALEHTKSQVQYVLQRRKPKHSIDGTPVKDKKELSGATLLALALTAPMVEIEDEEQLDRVINDLRENLRQLIKDNVIILRK